MSSVAAEAIARYSASILDRATVGCFLADQDTQLGPKKVQNHVVDLLVRGQPPQSESENAYKLVIV